MDRTIYMSKWLKFFCYTKKIVYNVEKVWKSDTIKVIKVIVKDGKNQEKIYGKDKINQSDR